MSCNSWVFTSRTLEQLQPRPQQAPQGDLFAPAPETGPVTPLEARFSPVRPKIGAGGPRPNPARWGARGRRSNRFWRERIAGLPSQQPCLVVLTTPRFPARMKEICPRGNKVVIFISLYHDKCLLFMLELY